MYLFTLLGCYPDGHTQGTEGREALVVRSHLLTLERKEVAVIQLLCTGCAFKNLFFTNNTDKIQVYEVLPSAVVTPN